LDKNNLIVGAHRSGLLIDGVDDTPFVAASLSHEAAGEIQCTIPFIRESGQFITAAAWFDLSNGALPTNLAFEDEKGPISLYGVRTRFASIGGGVSLGRFEPTNVIFARTDGSLDEELKVSAYRSQVDGLTEWVGATAVSFKQTTDPDGRLTGVDASVQSPEDIRWTQGEVQMTLSVHWNWTTQPDLSISEYVLLHSEFPDRRETPEAHLAQHRVVRSLLTVLSGEAVHYREHWVKDEQFPLKVLSGDIVDVPWQKAMNSYTLKEHYEPAPERSRHRELDLSFDELGPSGLQSWSAVYAGWRRPVDILVGLIGKPAGFIEDRVLSASMAIEACGYLLGPAEGEPKFTGRHVPFANQVFRCLQAVNFDCAGIGRSNLDIAAAAAHIFRRIKHPEHDMPEFIESWLGSQVLVFIARLVLIGQLNVGTGVDLISSGRMVLREIVDNFKRNDTFIGENGRFEKRNSPRQ
jgi:hypothetical protein